VRHFVIPAEPTTLVARDDAIVTNSLHQRVFLGGERASVTWWLELKLDPFADELSQHVTVLHLGLELGAGRRKRAKWKACEWKQRRKRAKWKVHEQNGKRDAALFARLLLEIAQPHFIVPPVVVGAVSSDEHRGRCRNAAQGTHNAEAGSTGSAKLVNGVLDPIPVGPAGIAMLAGPLDGGEHGELAGDLVGAVGLGVGGIH
jgi:hypothetical protein